MKNHRAHGQPPLFTLAALLVPLCACAEEDTIGPPPPPPPPPPGAIAAAPSLQGGAGMIIRSGATPELCLDAEGDVAASHTPVRLSACHGRENQRWSISPDPTGAAVITGIGGLCLDVRGQRPEVGSSTQLHGCNGGGNQRFRYEPDSHIRELATGLCLSATSISVGSPVVALPCGAGNLNQTWVIGR